MKPIKTLKVSISGVRGVIGDTLKPLLLCRFARAFATYMGTGSIVVGRDTRTSGEMVKHAVLSGLLSSGMRVIDVDICPVPTIQFAVRKLQARGGIAITASHNPAEWNALKFIKASGCFLNAYEAEELLSLYHQEEFNEVGASRILSLDAYDCAVEDHLQRIIETIQPPLEPKLKVAVDCCNGAGSVMTPSLLRKLRCEVVELNCTPNGYFSRPPEPLPANLGELCRAVCEHKADIGLAQDADADRLAIVSETGSAIGEEYTLALCTDFVLPREKGTVVVNLSTSRMIDDIAKSFDSRVIRTKIGEVNVTERMQEEEAVIGGEGNGGVIYPRVNMARDSFVAVTMIVSLMRLLGEGHCCKPISEVTQLFPAYKMTKLRYEIHPHRIPTLLEKLESIYRNEEVNCLDGLKINREEGWIHLRASNTEPVMRVLIEARTEELLRAYEQEVAEQIEALISKE